MMKIKLMAAAAVAALATATGASAHTPGWYAAADFGYHWPSDVRRHASSGPERRPGTSVAKTTGWRFGRLGYGFGPRRAHPTVRLELEGGYRPSDVKRVFIRSSAAMPAALCPPADPHRRRTGLRRARRSS